MILFRKDSERTADLAIDETTAGRTGPKVAHAGWFRDASASGPSHKGGIIAKSSQSTHLKIRQTHTRNVSLKG